MRKMTGWKQATVAGSFGLGVALFLAGRRAAGMLLSGVGLAVLASEYREPLRDFFEQAPDYIERGTRIVDALSRLADHLRQGREWEGGESGSPYLT
ncbi:MAG TPA: hypothetical protein VEG08_01460 [Terriglobales bacterium]|nr:hypothetical protein [Terriglobales bacterium]